MTEKITTGLNDRPRDSSIAQSGTGLPDDSSLPINVSDGDVERVREKLAGNGRTELREEIAEQIDKPQRGSA
jgi:hypothetical protein